MQQFSVLSTLSGKCQPYQESVNSSSLMFDNLFRKKDKNCQPNSEKDKQKQQMQHQFLREKC